ncbi:MAG TPA: response regulator transcription factor [Xanthobacteraceae bacterium]|jgi:DNA-binding NarL/FixJ family response regulator
MHALTPANDSKRNGAPQAAQHVVFRGADAMKTLVIGHHFLIRDALRGILKELENDAAILEASDGQEAVRVLSEHTDISLVILDLDLPDGSGLSVLAALREQHPAIPVVIISGAQDYNAIVGALNLGARGFILKSDKHQIMLSALELVFAGGIYIPREILALESSSVGRPASPRGIGNGRLSKLAELRLTGRQLDVLRAMMKGKCNKAICRDLNLAESTVKNHIGAILKKLGVRSRVEAVLAVGALGWDEPSADESSRQNAGSAKIVSLPNRLLGRA